MNYTLHLAFFSSCNTFHFRKKATVDNQKTPAPDIQLPDTSCACFEILQKKLKEDLP